MNAIPTQEPQDVQFLNADERELRIDRDYGYSSATRFLDSFPSELSGLVCGFLMF